MNQLEQMNAVEYEKFVDSVKGMTDEQKQVTLRQMPSDLLWNELMYRFNEAEQKISALKEVMR